MDRVRDGFAGDDKVRFMTLTLPNDAPHKLIMKWWNRLRASLRKIDRSLKYFLKKEFTKAGTRHLHILFTGGYIDKADLKRLWYLATDKRADIVDISLVKSLKNPAGYMMKYMTKDMSDRDLYDKGERRYTFSRHTAFKSTKRSYASMYGVFQTDIHIRIGHHINQGSKYWPEIRDKYVKEAGIHALYYFEAKTISPGGLEDVLQGDRYNSRKMIAIISKDVPIYPPPVNEPDGLTGTKWSDDNDLKPDKGKNHLPSIRKHHKAKHNKSNITGG